jgi:hypothetical protein
LVIDARKLPLRPPPYMLFRNAVEEPRQLSWLAGLMSLDAGHWRVRWAALALAHRRALVVYVNHAGIIAGVGLPRNRPVGRVSSFCGNFDGTALPK